MAGQGVALQMSIRGVNLSRFALDMKKTPPKVSPISPDILSSINPTVHLPKFAHF